MKKEGFTLIELLAVIVVLAIIALIATPIVMNTINSVKKGAAERSAENYIRAVGLAISTSEINKKPVLDGKYSIGNDGNLMGTALPDGKLEIDTNGNKPTGGTIVIKDGRVTTESIISIGEYEVSYNEESKRYEAIKLETYLIKYNLTNVIGDSSNVTIISTKDVKTLKFNPALGYVLPDNVTVNGATSVWDKETGTLILSKATGNVTVIVNGSKIYSNGDEVYFNVTTGTKCSSSDYTETQSNTGVKEGCMKFYAFNDDGKDTVNLLLDHNTTATVAWLSKSDYVEAGGTESDYGGEGKNDKGPLTTLKQLNSDTATWKGTETPINYIMDQTGQSSNAKYTIDYNGYKARLITTKEVAQITGNTTWDEKTAGNRFYFDTNSTSSSATCISGNTSGCSYGWLYDRTKINCKAYGCLNNSDKETNGYWAASSRAANPYRAWNVYCLASINYNTVSSTSTYGVRPVIEVLRSKLN